MSSVNEVAVGRVSAVQRVNEAHVVHALGDVGKEFAHGDTGLPVFRELPRRFEQRARLGELHPRLRTRVRFAVIAVQQRLGVEGIDLARAALHEQEDDPLGLRRVVHSRGIRGFQ